MTARVPVLFLALGVACSAGAGPGSAQEGSLPELRPQDLYKQCLPSVMTLKVVDKAGRSSFGTGFLAIKDGVAVTAWHVVDNAARVTAHFSDGQEFEVSGLIDKDAGRDTALIRVKVAGRPLMRLALTDPEVGARTYVIGAPRGLDFSLSDGIISQVRTDVSKLYQFTCPISPGNSGGPLIRSDGSAIGVVSFQYNNGQNLNFAMPIAYAAGLDATLATKPWPAPSSGAPAVIPPVRVRPVPPLDPAPPIIPETSVDHQAFDRALGRVLLLCLGGNTTLEYIRNHMMEGPGYLFRIPYPSYDYLRESGELSNALASMVPPDPERGSLKSHYLGWLKGLKSSLFKLSSAQDRALSNRGWKGSALEAVREGWEEAPIPLEQPLPAELALRRSSRAFEELVGPALGPIDQAPPFRLGAYAFPDTPLQVMAVEKKGLAGTLKLKTWDRLKAADGVTLTSLWDLARVLERAAGRKIEITLVRDEETRTLKVTVPADLAKYR